MGQAKAPKVISIVGRSSKFVCRTGAHGKFR
jgi:hypothetical protein